MLREVPYRDQITEPMGRTTTVPLSSNGIRASVERLVMHEVPRYAMPGGS